MRSFSDSYRAAGVDIEAGYQGVQLMKRDVERTFIPGRTVVKRSSSAK